MMTNIAHTPSPANRSWRLAKKKESSNLYVAHTALALYTMIRPMVNKESVTIMRKKSGVDLFVDTVTHL
jgi:hypothetical protein